MATEILDLEKQVESKIPELRRILKDECEIEVPSPQCDDFLARCLRQKDGNLDKARQLVEAFNKVTPEFATSWTAKLEPNLYDAPYYSIPVVFPHHTRDKLGRRVFVGRAKLWDPNKISFEEGSLAVWMMVQYGNTYKMDQTEGFVQVWDFGGFTLKQALAVSHRRMLSLAKWMTSGVMGKVKSCHLINHPRVVGLIYAGVKPFLSEKMRKRIKFHNNVEELHESLDLDPKSLPRFLGGETEVDECVDKEFMGQLLKSERFFQEMMNNRFPAK